MQRHCHTSKAVGPSRGPLPAQGEAQVAREVIAVCLKQVVSSTGVFYSHVIDELQELILTVGRLSHLNAASEGHYTGSTIKPPITHTSILT